MPPLLLIFVFFEDFMNFNEYLASKRSGNQASISQISSASKFFKTSDPETKKRIPSPAKPFTKTLKIIGLNKQNPEVTTTEIETDKKDDPIETIQSNTYLVRPSDLVSTIKKKKEAAKKPFFYKIPENLRDIRKHGDFKPRGISKVSGTKIIKKTQPAVSGPLSGQTFVITGLLKGYDRDELIELLQKYGAKVTGSVSRKTNCLIHGDKLEDGRHYSEGNKFKKAKELGTTIIDESTLEEMLTFLMGGLPKDNSENSENKDSLANPSTEVFECL